MVDNPGVAVNTVCRCINHYNVSGMNLALFDDERIYRYFYEINLELVVYHWTYKMDEINPNEIE